MTEEKQEKKKKNIAMPSSICYTSFDELQCDASGSSETNLTWLCPRLLRQTVRGTTFDSHSFKSCNLSAVTVKTNHYNLEKS